MQQLAVGVGGCLGRQHAERLVEGDAAIHLEQVVLQRDARHGVLRQLHGVARRKRDALAANIDDALVERVVLLCLLDLLLELGGEVREDRVLQPKSARRPM